MVNLSKYIIIYVPFLAFRKESQNFTNSEKVNFDKKSPKIPKLQANLEHFERNCFFVNLLDFVDIYEMAEIIDISSYIFKLLLM